MTTAKVALKSKDYEKAEKALQEEVSVRPENGEAWQLLGELYMEQMEYVKMNEAFDKALVATKPAIDERSKMNIALNRYNTWLVAFNKAISHVNEKQYSEALKELDVADALRPDYSENIFLRASAHESLGNESAASDLYKKYTTVIAADIKKGVEMGLAIGQSPETVEAKLGATTEKKLEPESGGYLAFPDKDLYVYFTPADKGGAFSVEGWQFFAGKNMPDVLKKVPLQLRSSPHYKLAVAAYLAGEKDPARYDEALEFLQLIAKFDPTQPGIGELIAGSYIQTNRVQEAKELLEKQIAAEPKNPKLYITYATLLSNKAIKNYRQASESLKKVVDLNLGNSNRDYQLALFNLGAIYKNWGSEIQDSIIEASNGNPSPAQVEKYKAPLLESVKYFEQLKKVKGAEGDFAVLAELGNLYDVLGEEAKLNATIKELEALRTNPGVTSEPEYWRSLSYLYAVVGNASKAEEAMAKAKELGG